MQGLRLTRIVLVEDQPAFADMYRLALELNGYEIQVAPTGAEALVVAASGWPDLMLLDVHLPDTDGMSVLQKLRTDKRSVALTVIILSNDNNPEIMRRAFELGVLDYLQKMRQTPGSVALRVKAWLENGHTKEVA
jgi:DNA-binding response OmpR family regulator